MAFEALTVRTAKAADTIANRRTERRFELMIDMTVSERRPKIDVGPPDPWY